MFYFSGTNKGIDRAALEACFSGCLIVSDNMELLRITGMRNLWSMIDCEIPNTAWGQYIILANLSHERLANLRKKIIQIALESSSLERVVDRIENVL